MRVERILFALLLAMVALLGATFLLDQPDNVAGIAHRDLGTMRRGGPAARHAPILWLGAIYGALQIAFFCGLLALGLRHREGLRGAGRPLLLGFGAYIATFALMFWAYAESLHDPTATWLGFPRATAVMLFGLWPVPLVFLGIYSLRFGRYVFTPDDRRAFDRLLEAKREREPQDT